MTAPRSRLPAAASTAPATGWAVAGAIRVAASARPAAAKGTSSGRPGCVMASASASRPAPGAVRPTVCRQDSCSARCVQAERLSGRIFLRRRHLPDQADAGPGSARRAGNARPAPASTASVATAPATRPARPATSPPASASASPCPPDRIRPPSAPPRRPAPAATTARCNGAGACRQHVPGTVCAGANCSGLDRHLGPPVQRPRHLLAAGADGGLRRLCLCGRRLRHHLPGRGRLRTRIQLQRDGVRRGGSGPVLEARRGRRRLGRRFLRATASSAPIWRTRTGRCPPRRSSRR